MLHVDRPARAESDRRRWVTAIAALAIASVAGCGSSEQPKTEAFEPSTVTSTPSPSPTASQNDAILAAYRAFFARQTDISLAGRDDRRALLEPIATDPALSRVLRGMFAADEIGEVGYGEAVVNPTVTKVDGDSATITDCQDTSKSGRMKRAGGKITTRGTSEAKVEATAKRGPDDQWRIATVDYQDATC